MADRKQQAQSSWAPYWPIFITWLFGINLTSFGMMAYTMLKLIQEAVFNANYKISPLFVVVRHSSVVKKPKPKGGTIKHRNLIESSCESLAARGFLRSYKPYNPVENVKDVVLGFCHQVLGNDFDQNSPLTKEDKYVLLNVCFEKLNHPVPNSLLHKIVNAKDVIEFYETPVSTTVPYDELKNQNLPPNLHIQYDYVRFNPETDIFFKGISAFPRSSTIVTGIKYKNKYSGFKTKSPFLDTEVSMKSDPIL